GAVREVGAGRWWGGRGQRGQGPARAYEGQCAGGLWSLSRRQSDQADGSRDRRVICRDRDEILRSAQDDRTLASCLASETRAEASGVMGSRGGTTRPISCTASGSTIGIERKRSVRPSVSASFSGMTLAQRPVRTCENSTIIEFDSRVGSARVPTLSRR